MLTVRPALPLLVACKAVAEKEAVIVCTLAVAGVTELLQVDTPGVAVDVRTQAAPNTSLPTEDERATVPAGNDLVPVAMSVTVTDIVLAWPITTEAGDSETEAEVERVVTATVGCPGALGAGKAWLEQLRLLNAVPVQVKGDPAVEPGAVACWLKAAVCPGLRRAPLLLATAVTSWPDRETVQFGVLVVGLPTGANCEGIVTLTQPSSSPALLLLAATKP